MKNISINPFDGGSSISKAISQLEQYKRQLASKTDELGQRVADTIAEKGQQKYDSAAAGYKGFADITVSASKENENYIVKTSGRSAVFIEFGTGVIHNSDIGHANYPLNVPAGISNIGEYGNKRGQNPKGWSFFNGSEWVDDEGISAQYCLAKATIETKDALTDIAKEVFGG